MSNKPNLSSTSLPTFPEEPCVWKSKSFPPRSKPFSKPTSLNCNIRNQWTYILDKDNEYFTRKNKVDTNKLPMLQYIQAFVSFLFIIMPPIISFISNLLSFKLKLYYNISLFSFICILVLYGICVFKKIEISNSKSIIVKLLQISMSINYVLKLYIDSLVYEGLPVIKNIGSLCCLFLNNFAFSNNINLSKMMYMFIYIVITITRIKRNNVTITVNHVFGFVYDVIIVYAFYQFEQHFQNERSLIWEVIENQKRLARIIHDKLRYPILKLNNKKGVEYLNLKAVNLFKKTIHKNNHSLHKDKSTDKANSKNSIFQRIKHTNTKTKKCLYTLHDILINEDYFDFNSYHCMMGNQQYFFICFVSSSIDLTTIKSTYLNCSMSLDLTDKAIYNYRAEILPYWNEKDKSLLILYPITDLNQHKNISLLIQNIRKEFNILILELHSFCQKCLLIEIQKAQNTNNQKEILSTT